VDVDRFVPVPRSAEVRRRLGWGDRRVVLTVGRLQKRKGHDMLIRALASVRQAVPDVLYSIVGDGDQRPGLERLAGELGLAAHVQFLGEVDDTRLVECYQQCDLFVLPNREVDGDIEGFGMVLLEAQACGKPVIAGASGGTAETMCAPETGRIVPCQKPEPLGQVVAELLASPAARDRMGQAARQWAANRFGWESLARESRQTFASHATHLAHARPCRTGVLSGTDE